MNSGGKEGGGGTTSPNDLLVGLIDSVYAAATDSERWSEFLHRVSQLFSGPAALRIGHGSDVRKHQISVATFDPAFLQSYALYYGQVCPFTSRDDAESSPRILVEEELVPMKEVERTEFYADWMRPQGLRRAVRGRAPSSSKRTIDILILRPERAGEFQPVEQTVITKLLPHLSRAAEISLRIGALESQVASSLNAFEHLGVGIALLTADRRVVFTNEVADRVLARGDGLTVTMGRLMASSAAQDRLETAVAAAAGQGRAHAGRAGAILSIPRSGSATPLSVAVAPLDEREQPFFTSEPLALVVMGAPEVASPVTEESLRTCYDFTPAEARVVAALCAGETLASYAALSKTSLNTVKTHLKAVFDKTGESRQADLIRSIAANPVLRMSR